MRPEWLLAAGTLQVLSFVCAAMVWQVALAGSLVAVRALGRRHVPARLVVGAIVVGAVTTYAAYAVAVAASIVVLRVDYAVNLTILLASAALGMAVIAVPIAIVWYRNSIAPRLRASLKRRAALASLLDTLASAPVDVLRNAGLWLREMPLQFAGIALDSATLFVVLSAVGAHVSPTAVFGSFIMASAAANALPLPGGLGAFEAALVMMLHLAGVPIEAALTATLLLRGFTLWLPMLPGVWSARQELSLPSYSRAYAHQGGSVL